MTTPLTAREEQVRSRVSQGLSSDEIAAELGISKRTVEAHLRNVFQKLSVTRRNQLAGAPARPEVVRRTPEVEASTDLRAENERMSRQVASYEAAMRQMIDRQFPLFDERVEITVTIGAAPGEDLVVERHWTRPKPYLIYRVARPIIQRHSTPPPFEDLGLTCEVIGQDMGVAVQPVLESRGLLVIVYFQPGLKERTEWVLHYRTPRLWDPLRSTGEDTIVWSTGTLDNPSTPGIGDVTFYFDFPADATGIDMSQDHQTGDLKEDRLPGGGTRFTWHNYLPGRHAWKLRMRAGTAGAGGRANYSPS
jgi:DNA-binding CsgD family transcriptional regulator